jgi:hypothetical protein
VLGLGRLRFEVSEISLEARNDELAGELWSLSAQAVANSGSDIGNDVAGQ